MIADLKKEPQFQAMLAASGQAANNDNDLVFNIITSGNEVSRFFKVGNQSGLVAVAKVIDREEVCSFQQDCVLEFQVR